MKVINFTFRCIMCFLYSILIISCENTGCNHIGSSILTDYRMNGRIRQLHILDNEVVFYRSLDSVYLGTIKFNYYNDFIKNDFKSFGDLESGEVSLLRVNNNKFITENTYSSVNKQLKLNQIFDSFKINHKELKFPLFNYGLHTTLLDYFDSTYKIDLNSELFLFSYIYIKRNPCETQFKKSDLSGNRIRFNISILSEGENRIAEMYYDLENEMFLLVGMSNKYDECFSVKLPDEFINFLTNKLNKVD